MEINIDLTREDFADFNKYHYLKKGYKKRFYMILAVALGLTLILKKDKEFEPSSFIVTFLLTGFTFGILNYVGMLLTIKYAVKLPLSNGSILGKRKFSVTEEGLIEESDTNKNLQKWKGIQSIETSQNSIFIFVDTLAAYVIPKRFFKDQTEQENFIKLIEENIKNAKN
ncbi:MAG: hypothetical protein CFE21_09380 [Bacteroidetes bacterium B1(2017)]|nr:MAG: hypothetical protein CFE21_09380 [Bacteroidetes bacterium B1(2017)]